MIAGLYDLEKLNKYFYIDSEYKAAIYNTINFEPNATIYKSLISAKSFYIINTISLIYLLKRNTQLSLRNLAKFDAIKAYFSNLTNVQNFIFKFSAITILNYNIFKRRFSDEVPFVEEIQYKGKIDQLMKSFLNPNFVLQKDIVILTLILYFSYFSIGIRDEKNIELQNNHHKQKIEKEGILEEAVIAQPQTEIPTIENRSPIKAGKFI